MHTSQQHHRPVHPAFGRHELGQNFLADRRVIARIAAAAGASDDPILEIGPGDGALTVALAGLGRPVTAVELDARRARRLAATAPPGVRVDVGDILDYRLPNRPYVIVGNIPFHLTTAILRKVLAAPHWTEALLLVQWEVARRRAGVGGASQLTAQWWPWFAFTLLERVPAHAFRPKPSVDGGLLRIERRPRPLVEGRGAYQRFVARTFAAPGRGLVDILPRTTRLPRPVLERWMSQHGVAPRALPKQLTAEQWAGLWRLADAGARGADRRGR